MQKERIIYGSILEAGKIINDVCLDEQEVSQFLISLAKILSCVYPTIIPTLRKELGNES
jgi:hypothetical protein